MLHKILNVTQVGINAFITRRFGIIIGLSYMEWTYMYSVNFSCKVLNKYFVLIINI